MTGIRPTSVETPPRGSGSRAGSRAPVELDALTEEVKLIRLRLSLLYPLEAEEIWRRGCWIHQETPLALTEAVAEAEWEITTVGPE